MANATEVQDIEFLQRIIAPFDNDGRLMAETTEVWEVMKDLPDLKDRFRAHMSKAYKLEGAQLEGAVTTILAPLPHRLTPRWLSDVRAKAQSGIGVSVGHILWTIYAVQHEILADVLKNDVERMARLKRSLTQQAMVEADVWSSEFERLRKEQELAERSERSNQFNEEMLATV